jgi:hypothetical protein
VSSSFVDFHPTNKLLLGVERVEGMVDERFQLFNDDATLRKLEQLSFQFPSVNERIKYYMGSWYHYKPLDRSLMCSKFPFFSPENLGKPSNFPYIYNESNIDLFPVSRYVRDIKRNVIAHASDPSSFRMIASLGDGQRAVEWPVFIKSRRLDAPDNEKSILVLLNELRHYPDSKFNDARHDVEWEKKIDTMVWRGASTGKRDRFNLVQKYYNATKDGIDVGFSTLDERFISSEEMKKFVREKLNHSELLRYKYLVSIEGNDVATGLKWMLYSNSVVFMPPPTQETWAMEGLLVPYYHYVPLAPDLSDLREKLEWAHKNDDICQRIAHHSTKFIEDLYISGEAKNSSRLIHREIIRRYEALYGEDLSFCSADPKPVKSCQFNHVLRGSEFQTNKTITWLMSYPDS